MIKNNVEIRMSYRFLLLGDRKIMAKISNK